MPPSEHSKGVYRNKIRGRGIHMSSHSSASHSCETGGVCETMKHLVCTNTCNREHGQLEPNSGRIQKSITQALLPNATIVFTNARDEMHVAEWVQHHLNLGFDQVVVFDHLSVHPVLEELERWSPRVDVCRYTKEVEPLMKDRLMNAALWLASSNGYAWMLYEDVDEYLVLNNHDSIASFINKWSFADQIYINWLMFGSNFLKRDPEGPIIGRYLRSNGRLAYRHKALVRPSIAVKAAGPHTYELIGGSGATSVSMDGERAYGLSTKLVKMGYNEVDAYIAHYIVQAEEVYLDRKMRRPRDDTGLMRPQRNVSLMQLHNAKICTEVMAKYEEMLVRSMANARKSIENRMSCNARLLQISTSETHPAVPYVDRRDMRPTAFASKLDHGINASSLAFIFLFAVAVLLFLSIRKGRVGPGIR